MPLFLVFLIVSSLTLFEIISYLTSGMFTYQWASPVGLFILAVTLFQYVHRSLIEQNLLKWTKPLIATLLVYPIVKSFVSGWAAINYTHATTTGHVFILVWIQALALITITLFIVALMVRAGISKDEQLTFSSGTQTINRKSLEKSIIHSFLAGYIISTLIFYFLSFEFFLSSLN